LWAVLVGVGGLAGWAFAGAVSYAVGFGPDAQPVGAGLLMMAGHPATVPGVI
jgi:hypothetical protein